MKLRTFFSTLLIFTLGLLALGLGGLWALTTHNPAYLIKQGGQAFPNTTVFVPKQAPLAVSLLTRPDHLTDLWEFLAEPGSRRKVRTEINGLEEAFLANTGLNYETDIQPWIDEEVTFAVTSTDLDQLPDNGLQPGYLLILSCRDSIQAKEVLDLFWQKRAIAGENLVFESVSGSKLIHTRKADLQVQDGSVASSANSVPFSPLASAIVGDQYVLLANQAEVLRQALTSAQAEDLNLDHDLDYRTAMTALPQPRIGIVVVNLQSVLNWIEGPSAFEQLSAFSDLGTQSPAFDQAFFSLRLHKTGLIADTVLLAAPGHTLVPRSPKVSSVERGIRYFPADVPFVAAGYDLDSLWRETLSGLFNPFEESSLLAALSGSETDKPPTLRNIGQIEDLLGWIGGDYAIGLLPIQRNGHLDWLLATQHLNATDAHLDTLDKLARAADLNVGTIRFGEQIVTAWTRLSLKALGTGIAGRPLLDLNTQVIGLHTHLDDMDVLATSPTAINAALSLTNDNLGSKTLKAQARWQSSLVPLSQPNEGYLYLDWPAISPLMMARFARLRVINTLIQPFLDHLETITLTSYGQSERLQTGGMFLSLSNP